MYEVFHCHKNCNITRASRRLYNLSLPGTFLPSMPASFWFRIIWKKSCSVHSEYFLWVTLDITWFHRFSSLLCRSWSAFHSSWLPRDIPPLSELLQPSLRVFKVNAHLLGYFNSLHFHLSAIHYNTVQTWQNHSNGSYSFAPQILTHFKISSPCKACCSIQSPTPLFF